MTLNKGLETGGIAVKKTTDQLFLARRIYIHLYLFCANYKKGKSFSITTLFGLNYIKMRFSVLQIYTQIVQKQIFS